MKKFMIAACLAIGLQANMTANADDIEPSVVRAESTGGFYDKIDLGIVKYHFETGSGRKLR